MKEKGQVQKWKIIGRNKKEKKESRTPKNWVNGWEKRNKKDRKKSRKRKKGRELKIK